jgi:DNA-binding NarL/FixJ family response regulator
MTVTVLIVDDHAPFRALARELLELDGFEVVGEAAEADAALELASRLKPRVVLLDIGLPEVDGFEAARLLARLVPAPIVVLISSRDRSAYRHRLVGSTAHGFLAKSDLSGAALTGLIG